MRKHIQSTSLPVFALSLAVLFAILGTMLPGAPARADDCVASPNSAAPSGQHWWYRTDRATKRKCWFLGPKDKEAAARKADRQERADDAEPEAPASAAAEPASTQSAPAPAARSDANGVQPGHVVPSFVFVTQESVPYLVDWNGLLKEAGIVSADDNAATEWADGKGARTAWAMRDQQDQEPAEAQPGKDEARAPQTAAAEADTAKGPATASSGLPATTIAAILLAGVTGPAIFSIMRTRRRRHSRVKVDAHAGGAYGGTIPGFLQRQEATSLPSGQGYEQPYAQDYGQAYGQDDGQPHEQEHARPYGGEEELRRILGMARRRAA